MFDHFGILAPVYEKFIKPKAPDQIIKLLDLPTPGRLLDVGGGTGRVSVFLESLVDEVIIADLSHKMLIQSHLKPGLHPVCSHSERLPFPDGSFDRVIMIDALHHVCDQAETASELWRIIKPGGKIVVEEPDIHHWAVKLVAVGEKLALMRSHFLAPGQIRALFPSLDGKVETFYEDYIARIVITKNG
ncbi:MAG: class I SAM-dependent methyltransferase [Anaerolineales bacterium]|jgi:ubiquinone/menaquinone biosynthesis C-methylase UbiE